MSRMSPKEMDAVLRLDSATRYSHFVKRVVGSELAWALWRDGWALMEDTDGQSVFPLWPAREYAELWAVDEWDGYSAEEISLYDLLDELLPKLAARAMRPGVFPTPKGKGLTPTVEDLTDALRTEMKNYE